MKSALVLLATVASVSSHSTWQDLWVGSEDKGTTCARTVKDNNPIASLSSPDMFCGRGPVSSSGVCEVAGMFILLCYKSQRNSDKKTMLTAFAAGSPLTVEMHAQPGDRKCSQPAIGGNHYGPVLIYMAKVADAKTATSGSFFKVAEDGYTGTTASWGTEILNANCGKRAFTVPKSLASGDYLVRSEAIALHAGAGNPQPYVTCFQVKVTGGGSATPSGVSFPGGYKTSDALFQKAIYDSSFKYVSPGPAVYSG
ncbi:lytic polysaccharide monooxygenase [Cucurbitaria berberidis CBS 394.84]|uniref:AA9 family lytic polysaccharide monooxygenase n=1 Tax=Cucurbitaria berberidis CBS 394.84 TaxID=1168544 RepID=A0A9P4L707_9PLEO|nr:lytic polysaccharide monooxygenase [Cucurbitaria berberidis CBS 394.84]KAF1844536.1 lytic polysaccharide monooxygenase [Cucurbitaria berberidis CBS 394.84]